jgi:hypothetical protein
MYIVSLIIKCIEIQQVSMHIHVGFVLNPITGCKGSGPNFIELLTPQHLLRHKMCRLIRSASGLKIHFFFLFRKYKRNTSPKQFISLHDCACNLANTEDFMLGRDLRLSGCMRLAPGIDFTKHLATSESSQVTSFIDHAASCEG